MIDIKSMTIGELEKLLADLGQPKFRAKQVFQWLHQKQALSFDEIIMALVLAFLPMLGGEAAKLITKRM